jgi:hypothetical protein
MQLNRITRWSLSVRTTYVGIVQSTCNFLLIFENIELCPFQDEIDTPEYRSPVVSIGRFGSTPVSIRAIDD